MGVSGTCMNSDCNRQAGRSEGASTRCWRAFRVIDEIEFQTNIMAQQAASGQAEAIEVGIGSRRVLRQMATLGGK